MNSDQNKQTHFGFTSVSEQEKTDKVGEVFHSVAKRYDIMNDLMSLGMHRLWKNKTVAAANIRPGQSILDLAGGTGDLTKRFAKRTGPTGHVTLADINASMLAEGRARLIDQNIFQNVSFVEANAEALPFEDNAFHRVCIAFGLRNVTRKENALAEMYRVLKPGGKALILEFSKPTHSWLTKLYDTYSFHCIPKIGECITRDKESYQYLVESIRMHPDQDTLLNMLTEQGFEQSAYQNLSGGIVALHYGYKF